MFVIPVLISVVCACSDSSDYSESDSDPAAYESTDGAYAADLSGSNYSLDRDPEASPTRDPFDEDEAREAAEREVARQGYVGSGTRYGCTVDCSGHEAGFAWRAERGYQGYNPDSPSFNEGGRAFDEEVEEKVEEMKDDYEAGNDPDY
ncbi:MAG: hypothetical protein ACREBO_08595 [Novosphingobium sp.]